MLASRTASTGALARSATIKHHDGMQTALPSPKNKKPPTTIIVLGDYVCPYTYIGVSRLAELRKVLELEIDWRFIESRPETPPQGTPIRALHFPAADWRALMDNLVRMARQQNLPFQEPTLMVNSRRAILFAEALRAKAIDAASRALFDTIHNRLFAAYFSEGRDIGAASVLTEIAAEYGVQREFLDQAWQEPTHSERLLENQAMAQRIGIKATPAFVIGDEVLEGAVPVAMLAETLVEIHGPH